MFSTCKTTKSKTTPNLRIQARPFVRGFAGAVREYPAQQLQRRAQRRAGGEGADHALIFAAVERRLVERQYPREFLAGEGNIKITLVVPHQDIEFGPIFFDELRFFDERLGLGFGLNPFQPRCLLRQPPHLLSGVLGEI